jgi:hypothetical protein
MLRLAVDTGNPVGVAVVYRIDRLFDVEYVFPLSGNKSERSISSKR